MLSFFRLIWVFGCLFVCLPACLPARLSVYPSFCLYVCMSVYLSVNPSTFLELYVCLLGSLLACLLVCSPVCPSVCLSVWQSVCLSELYQPTPTQLELCSFIEYTSLYQATNARGEWQYIVNVKPWSQTGTVIPPVALAGKIPDNTFISKINSSTFGTVLLPQGTM